ncbi:tyrosine-type recombinase/integrase [Tenacibaculum soleae]|uniref:tyrosine-type recombinase/integrase n=1 Tax=Tenacibaculum soleae TaxID=447689 RepID=UPI0026E2CF9F|nr:site-specific integrase [Tenacibaculum soleae]MDO6813838.1 site-specific integrase [Tenacibaculum soleae]
MSKSQNSKKLIAFVDYIPAELKENKTWEIVYYAIDPLETDSFKRLKRKRNRVKPISNITERRKFAKRIIANLNEKLAKGWTPFLHEQNVKVYTKLFDAFDIFIKQLEQKISKGALRKDTLRAYSSYIKNIKGFYEAEGKEDCFVTDFNEEYSRKFLDVIFYERENSARTHNNYLGFIGVFTRWLIKRRYINVDFTSLLSKIKQGDKKRTIIPQQDRVGIFNYLEKKNFHYGVLCQTAFYCLIRRTEFTKLKVKDVILANGIINVPAEASKNRKSQIVTIPLDIINSLATHLSTANNDDYLFSCNNYKPGKEQLTPRKISYTWDKLRKTLKLADTYQWYSLKDTGITNYLQLGIPTIDVKNQARHSSIQQTEEYLPKNIFKAIGNIQSAKLNF